MFYAFLLLAKIAVLAILISIVRNGLKQNQYRMNIQKEVEEEFEASDYGKDEAPAVPPKIPDSQMEKVNLENLRSSYLMNQF